MVDLALANAESAGERPRGLPWQAASRALEALMSVPATIDHDVALLPVIGINIEF